MDNIEDVFDLFASEMRNKYKAVMDKKGNVPDPWDQFTPIHNRIGLQTEFLKWLKRGKVEDLIDVANRALFLWLQLRDRELKDI